ncbi:MAG: RsmB/NOP family class I SAM-dependent RNA methyltransferase [Deltaproteobacteria bacterium]|nr:RsmB/NOP family class I SAM-dependent RNA methyltransferase [Deltaproteobacteria bacterium]
MNLDARRLAGKAWDSWLSSDDQAPGRARRPLDRIFGGLVRDAKASAVTSSEGWSRVTAAARFAGYLAARNDLAAWTAATDPRAEIARIPDFWPAVERLMADPLPPERAKWRQGDPAEQVAAAGVHPAWTAPLLDRFGDALWKFLVPLDTAPPLWVRVRREEELPSVETALRADGFKVNHGPGLALRVRGERPVHFATSFTEGAIEIQDLASQRVIDALPPGAPVWDACAGEGGKTLALASRLRGKSSVSASDLYPNRIEALKKRVKRSGWQNVRTFAWDGTAKPSLPREASAGFPLVLVDAPCSASGTWRRNPEVRLQPPAGEELLALQAQILRHAAEAVRAGGALALATCSVDRRENEAQLEALGWPVEQSGLFGSPGEDADTLILGVARR